MAEVKEKNPAVADSAHPDHEADATTGNPTTDPGEKASREDQEKAFQRYENRADIESRDSIRGRYTAQPGEYSVRGKDNGDTVPANAKDVEKKSDVTRDN